MSRRVLTEEEKKRRKEAKKYERRKIKDTERLNTVDNLRNLICSLQDDIKRKRLDSGRVREASGALDQLGYKYNADDFPPLPDPSQFKDLSKDSPQTLAEAMLWKLVRWKAYKNFAANFQKAAAQPTKNTDVVLFAFAKHLRDRNFPIYDQHSLRALWACGELGDDEIIVCKSVLFSKTGKWKDSGSGKHSVQAYDLFCKHLERLAGSQSAITKEQLDHLLMPLGQAIKQITRSYEQFLSLCQPPRADDAVANSRMSAKE